MKEVGWYVSDGCYDILDEGGNILMPHAIKSSVEPGSRLSMRMWSKPEINHELLMAEKEAIQKSKSMATYLAIGEGETDEKKQVVKFKDALGRIYVFPFHRSKTWDVSLLPSKFSCQKKLTLIGNFGIDNSSFSKHPTLCITCSRGAL